MATEIRVSENYGRYFIDVDRQSNEKEEPLVLESKEELVELHKAITMFIVSMIIAKEI